MDIDMVRSDRLKFLNALYELSGADEHKYFSMWEIGKSLKLDRDQTSRITQYLYGEGMMEYRALGGIIGITHYGIREVEEAKSIPDQPTYHFPAVNVINIGSMVNSAIQQASPDATQALQAGDTRTDGILEVVDQVKGVLDRLGLRPAERTDLEAEIGTVQFQMKSSRPKVPILRESLASMRSILEGASGGALAAGLVKMIAKILGG